jgi:hypothetical protein
MDLGHIAGRWGSETARNLAAKAQRYIREGKITASGTLVLTKEGKLLADGIAVDLFVDPADGGINHAGGGSANTVHPELPTG